MTKYIELKSGEICKVDEIDFEDVRKFIWRLHCGRYASTKIDGKLVLMHRMLLCVSGEEIIDHVDGNGLNNSRSNLRICTHAENMMNRKKHKSSQYKYKGVEVASGKYITRYRAYIRKNGKKFHIGVFDTQEEAALAYDAKARELFGEFARCNFEEEQ